MTVPIRSMKPSVTVAFDPDIRPIIRDGGQLVCRACCDLMQVHPCDNGCCAMTTCCAGHPQIMIRNGKMVGTSA